MAFSIVNTGLNFCSIRPMLKPTSFKSVMPSSTARKAFEIARIGCSTTHDTGVASSDGVSDEILNVRRSGNYPPPMWDYDSFQSLNSTFKGEVCRKHASELKENVRMLLNKEDLDSLRKLELVDTIQRLGVSYHFQDETRRILEAIHSSDEKLNTQDLYAASLKFRLSRQHNFDVPQEIFKELQDESGKFKGSLSKDMKGVVSLYEASYLSIKNEKIMDDAQHFATKHMKDYTNDDTYSKDENLVKLVSHALEYPQHWREPRQEAWWFIDFYETSAPAEDYVSDLLYFAKLDFNMVQSIYQDDLKHLSEWWKNTEWGEKLGFARERLMECFYWSVGYNSNPEFIYGRRVLAAVTAIITTIDDIYDVYATLEELELLTKLTKRWNAADLEQLPEYIKVCFTVVYNGINEVANVAEREHGISILPYFQKVWTDLFEAYLLEAKWYYSGYKPSLREYLDNAWISISVPVILTHSYFLSATSFTDKALQSIESYPKIVRLAATILRLADDMGTSYHELERGDNPKVVQCYMNDTGASEDEAREYVRHLLIETWKELNEEKLAAESTFPKPFIDMCLNLDRIALSVYKDGDGHGAPTLKDKERLTYLFVNPITI